MAFAETRIEIENNDDVVVARQTTREIAEQLGLGSADQTRLVSAVSELVRDTIQQAGRGVCIISDESDVKVTRIQVVVEDTGSPSHDSDTTMTDKFNAGWELGDALMNAKRLVDEFHIETKPGLRTITVAITQLKT